MLKFLNIEQNDLLKEQIKEILKEDHFKLYKNDLPGFPSKMMVGKNEFFLSSQYSPLEQGMPDYSTITISKSPYCNNLDCQAFFAEVFGPEGKILLDQSGEIIARVDKSSPGEISIISKPSENRGWAIVNVLAAFKNCIKPLVDEGLVVFIGLH